MRLRFDLELAVMVGFAILVVVIMILVQGVR
jgi:hypothetical protein